MKTLSRRDMLLKTAAGLGAVPLLPLSDSGYANLLWQGARGAKVKGRLKQSACRWCYRNIPLEDLAKFGAEIGLRGIDLVGPAERRMNEFRRLYLCNLEKEAT